MSGLDDKKANSIPDMPRTLLVLILCALCIEIFVFNIRFFTTLFYKETEYPIDMLSLENCEWMGEGYLQLTGEEGGRLYVKGLDGLLQGRKFKNLKLDIDLPLKQDVPHSESGILNIGLHLRDEGHDRYAVLAEHVYREDIEKSKYISVDASEVVKTIVLDLKPSEGDVIQVNGITVNAKEDLSLSGPRLSVIFILTLLVFLLRKRSFIWRENATDCSGKKMIVIVLTGAVLLLPAVILNVSNEYLKLPHAFLPYQRQAEAFAAGSPALLEQPPAELSQMDDPYDYTAREAAGLQADIDYLWDTAYYKGEYHTYFGIVPCVLFYLPVWLISGKHLTDAALMIFLSAAIYVGMFLMMREWLKRRKAETCFGWLWITLILCFMGSGLVTDLSEPDPHDIPRVAGLMFLIWGLYLWQRAICRDKKGLRCGILAAGSLCMALAVGCRANQVLWSVLALPLFWEYRVCDGEYDKRARGKALAALFIPYIPVALALMAFNAARFGSVFDFGYNYNLTVLDYTQKNVFLDRILIGIYEYLFRLPALSYVFPFLEKGNFAQENLFGHGDFYYTLNYGGLLLCNPLLWCLPAVFAKQQKERGGRWLLFIAMAEMMINICVAGVAYHYRVDFALFMLLAAAIGMLGIGEQIKGSTIEGAIRVLLCLSLAAGIMYYSCFYYISSIRLGDTQLYYRMFYAWSIL